jgi:hypothetical protein
MASWVWVVERLMKPERGLGFVTAAEVYLWFLIMVLMEKGLWGWRGGWVLSGGDADEWKGKGKKASFWSWR